MSGKYRKMTAVQKRGLDRIKLAQEGTKEQLIEAMEAGVRDIHITVLPPDRDEDGRRYGKLAWVGKADWLPPEYPNFFVRPGQERLARLAQTGLVFHEMEGDEKPPRVRLYFDENRHIPQFSKID
jgi:hypothetical protein